MKIELPAKQRKYLRAMAHVLKPIVFIGQMGLTPAVERALDEALSVHELVKVKFNDDKNKSFKRRSMQSLEQSTGAFTVGMIGHTAIFYRPHPEAEKRNIVLPQS